MEILVAGELLTDQRRSDHLAILLDHAPLRLVGEDNTSNARHHERVDETRDDGQRDHQHDCGTDFLQHGFPPHARCKAVTKRSIALMPMNGMMTPPTP